MSYNIKCARCGVVNWKAAGFCICCGNEELQARGTQTITTYNAPAASGKTFSQKVARFFECVDYALLAPASFGLLMSLLSLPPYITLAVAVWFTFGCLLLRGFYRHSRGRLTEAGATSLWRATILYNLADVVGLLWAGGDDAGVVMWCLYPALVVVLSSAALVSDNRRERLSRGFEPNFMPPVQLTSSEHHRAWR